MAPELEAYFRAIAPPQMGPRQLRWWLWHKRNPHILVEFERRAMRAARKHQKFGAWAIMSVMRWDWTVETDGEDFKISNELIAYYARFFMHRHPEFEGFFDTKRMAEEPNFKLLEWDRGA